MIFAFDRIENDCRRQNKCSLKKELFLGLVENIVGKGDNAS